MLINLTRRNAVEQILSSAYFYQANDNILSIKSIKRELIYYDSGMTSNAKTTRFSDDSNGIV
tara:strand:+ start:165 stop:350 length:186 start_codon:yes stop_codon:yes gene_type:complete